MKSEKDGESIFIHGFGFKFYAESFFIPQLWGKVMKLKKKNIAGLNWNLAKVCIHIQDIFKGYSERPNVLGKNAYHFISKVMDLILNLASFSQSVDG